MGFKRNVVFETRRRNTCVRNRIKQKKKKNLFSITFLFLKKMFSASNYIVQYIGERAINTGVRIEYVECKKKRTLTNYIRRVGSKERLKRETIRTLK